jgi:hypothetical protein
LSPCPDQGGARIRERYWFPCTGKSFVNHQYVTINKREKYPLLLSISPRPTRKPTRITIGRRIMRPKLPLVESKTGVDKREHDIKPQTNHIEPVFARRFAMMARKQSWIISEKRQ